MKNLTLGHIYRNRIATSPAKRSLARSNPNRVGPLVKLNDELADWNAKLEKIGLKGELKYLHPTKGWRSMRPRRAGA